MAEKDISEKILLDYNDVFADIVNGLIFDGKQRIKPETLANKQVKAMYKADNGKLHEEERDIFKLWEECGIEIALCGLENQSEPYKYMPARVIGYDGAAYREQLLNRKIKNLVPVVTIVLNFGSQKWNEPTTLKGLFEEIPSELKKYVNDYKIHVFDIAWLTEEEVARFKGDFKVVADFFVRRRENPDYFPDDPTELSHVDAVLKLLTVMTGDRRYEEVAIEQKGEVKTMCDVAERLVQKGIAQGNAQGFAQGRDTTLYELVEAGDLSIKKAAKKAGVSEKKFKDNMLLTGHKLP